MSMSDVIPEQIKRFVFSSKSNNKSELNALERLEIIIPELIQVSYSFYTWSSAPVLAWFLWEKRASLTGKRILEIGSGTALPGILAAKCGASVTLSDSALLPKSLAHTRRCCQLNNLTLDKDIRVIGLTWGLFLASSLSKVGEIDIILGSDCFYEPSVFEEVVVLVAYLLEKNLDATFYCTYQERSSDWSIEHLLAKWRLKCRVLSTADLGASVGLNINELTGDHSIHLLEISRSN